MELPSPICYNEQKQTSTGSFGAMKRFWAILWIAMLLPLSSALADWELEGDLLYLVAPLGEYETYESLCPQAGSIGALTSPDHNVLLMDLDGDLQAYTGVLYQPGSGQPAPVLVAKGIWFNVIYNENLWYTFQKTGRHYQLTEGMFNGMMVEWSVDGSYYRFTDQSGESVEMPGYIVLDYFNVDLFPKTLDEVRHLNRLSATINDGRFLTLKPGLLLQYAESLSKASVYTAPYAANAFRVRANGKNATVSFQGDVWVLREWRNENGGEYYMIRYAVNAGKQRIGFIPRSHIDGPGSEPWPRTETLNARVVTTRKTVITDDPHFSHSKVMQLAQGARLRCMGVYDANHAYVGTVDRSGRQVWGFVPLRDLDMLAWKLYDHETRLMAQLEGIWQFQHGPDKPADLLTLHADGTYEGFDPLSSGEWFVTRYDPAAGLYVDDPVYEISFIGSNGRCWVEGLTVEGDAFTIHGHEEKGLYTRVVE